MSEDITLYDGHPLADKPDLSQVRGFARGDRKRHDKYEPVDVPYEEQIDFDEIQIEELDIRRARSFRADLLHKLNILVRLYGTQWKAAQKMGVHRVTFSEWLNARRLPDGNTLAALDRQYAFAIEKLVIAKRKQDPRFCR